jgi:hypothetical protein
LIWFPANVYKGKHNKHQSTAKVNYLLNKRFNSGEAAMLQAQVVPNASDDERLLRYMFAGSQVDDMLAAGAMQTNYSMDHPITNLIKEFSKRPKVGRIYISQPGLKLEISGRN